MFIKKINKYLPQYKNIEKQDFLNILDISNNRKFDLYKLEKDFLLTLILIKFWEKYSDLIFKWWTCLNKVYFPYFRLSEDLDFVINHEKWRTARKTLLRKYEIGFIEDLELLWLKLQSKKKVDEYRLAMFVFEYESIIDNTIQTIKIDISLKRNLRLTPVKWAIESIYKDKFLEEDIFGLHYINCIDLKESTAEKLRAALTRWVPAIRDLFDIWFIKNNSDFDFNDIDFIKLVEIKLAEVNYVYTLEKQKDNLKKQIETDLKPVLFSKSEFDFEGIYEFILWFKLKV